MQPHRLLLVGYSFCDPFKLKNPGQGVILPGRDQTCYFSSDNTLLGKEFACANIATPACCMI